MKSVGLFDAKTRLSELCRQVEETGESILIERRGQPIAELSPPRRAAKPRKGIVAELASFEKKHPRNPDEPEFPDIWLERSMPGPNPLDQGKAAGAK